MQVNGLSPNAGTCSILLKGKLESREDVSQVLLLVDAMEELINDELFVAVADACILFGHLSGLSKQLGNFSRQSSGGISAQTYAAMIKAFGRTHDMKQVWNLWDQMTKSDRQIQLSAEALGAMVDALVANGLCSEAWRLVQDLKKDGCAQPLLDFGIYSAILKGFANLQVVAHIMAVYEAIKAGKVQMSDATSFNTILCALTQCGAMQHVPALLADMEASQVSPDVATYGMLVKGVQNRQKLDLADKAIDSLTAGRRGARMSVGCLDEVVAALGGVDSEQAKVLLQELQRD